MLGFLAVAEAPLGCFEITASEFQVSLIIVNIKPIIYKLSNEEHGIWKLTNEKFNIFSYSVNVFQVQNVYATNGVITRFGTSPFLI